jgi:thymidylate synthase
MNIVDKQYTDLIQKIIQTGTDKEDRTGTGTRSVFGHQMRFPISTGNFPIVTVKETKFRSLVHELIWFLRGEESIKYLVENDVGIWDEWADEDGNVGPLYGVQWRKWEDGDGNRIDQLQNVIDNINSNPDSRRHVVSAWNAGKLEDMNLFPCHIMFQFYSRTLSFQERVTALEEEILGGPCSKPVNESVLQTYDVPERALDCQIYIRSNDTFLGLPFNISSYSLLTIMVSRLTGHAPGELVYTIGDAHLYKNHFEPAVEMMNRKSYSLPSLEVSGGQTSIDDFEFEDFDLKGYKSGSWIKAPIAV